MPRNLFIAFLTLITAQCCHCQCGKDEYKRCVMLADPLLQDSHLIYPDNLQDVDRVCRAWNQFVACLDKYTELCFTENKRKEFIEAIRNPSDLVKQMCSSSDYQKEYLKHAPCMKAILIDDSHCGRHYRHLVNQVSGEPATPALCCSHYRFRECVMDQTQRSCDKEAFPFARHIIDKAMGFLQDQCSFYMPGPDDCPGADFYTGSGNTWSDSNSIRILPEKPDNWASDRRNAIKKYDWMTQSRSSLAPENQAMPSDNVADNTRTAHSRGMSWESPTDQVSWRVSAGVQTEATWTQNVKVTTSSNMLVDEPNQQGLSHENSATSYHNGLLLINFVVVSLFFYFYLR